MERSQSYANHIQTSSVLCKSDFSRNQVYSETESTMPIAPSFENDTDTGCKPWVDKEIVEKGFYYTV